MPPDFDAQERLQNQLEAQERLQMQEQILADLRQAAWTHAINGTKSATPINQGRLHKDWRGWRVWRFAIAKRGIRGIVIEGKRMWFRLGWRIYMRAID